MKILIVDDDEMNLEILEEILHDAGFATERAVDGKQALEMVACEPDIRIILLDRMMPVMDGMEFIAEFRKNPRWEQIAVVFQTAATRPKELIEGMETGAYYYLTKPFNKNIVLSIVRSAIDDLGIETPYARH